MWHKGGNNNCLTNSLVDYVRLNSVSLEYFKHIVGDAQVS